MTYFMPRDDFDLAEAIPPYQETENPEQYYWGKRPHPFLRSDYRAVLGALASNLTPEEVAVATDVTSYGIHIPEDAALRAAERMLPAILQAKISEPLPTTKSQDYFETVRFAVQQRFVGNQKGVKRGDVLEGMRKLAEINPDFQKEFIIHGVEYVEQLRRDNERGYIGLQRWCKFLHDTTDLSPSNRVGIQSIVKSTEPADLKNEKVFEDKGRNTLALLWGYAFKDSIRSRTGEQLRNFTFGPNIVDKSPDNLLAVIDNIETIGAAETFGYTRHNATMTSMACDLFIRTLQEAGTLGWANANVLIKALEDMPRRQILPYQSIIHLSNKATHVLNKSGVLGETKLGRLSPIKIESAPEAIRRCMFVVFELGQQPPQESLNFLLSGEVCALTLAGAESESKDTDDESTLEQQASMYRQMRQGTSSAYWDKWRSGYGILS